MSGDVQPRKRKDKKKKKDDDDLSEPNPTLRSASSGGDIHMHVQSEHGTGGNWCAKIIFFILLAGLGCVIGLIIAENRGGSDVDTPLSESRFSEYFEGWVDENRADDHHAAIKDIDDIANHDDPLSEEADNSAGDDDEEIYDDDDHDNDGIGNNDDNDDDNDGIPDDKDHDDDNDGIPDTEDNDDDNDGISDEHDDDDGIAGDDDHDNDGVSNKDDNDDDNDGVPDDQDHDDDNDGIPDAEDVDDDNDGIPDHIDDDDVIADDNDHDNDGISNIDDNDDDNDGILDDQDQDDDNDGIPDDVDRDDDNDGIPDHADDDEAEDDDDHDDDGISNKEDHDDDNDGIPDHEDQDDDNDGVPDHLDHDDDNDGVPDHLDDDEHGVDDDDHDDDGVNNKDDHDDDNDGIPDDVDHDDDNDGIPDDVDHDDDNDGIPDHIDEDHKDDDDEIAKEIDALADEDDSPFDEEKNPKYLNALNTNKDLKSERVEGDDQVSSAELKRQMDELVENYNKLAESLNTPKVEVKREKKADDDDEKNDDDEDDDDAFEELVENDDGEDLHLQKIAVEKKAQAKAKKDAEENDSSELPSKAGEKSYSDQYIQDDLKRANKQLDENPKAALSLFESLTQKYPKSIGALLGKAKALDKVADKYQSNKILMEAIAAYKQLIQFGDYVENSTFQDVAERCLERMRFVGQNLQAVEVHEALIKRFPDEPQFRNQLAVSYLLAGRLDEAKYVLHETLLRWRQDGFALVHYGFVLKNLDKNMAAAVQYLQEGLETGDEGTVDGRFFFHLGDALQRLGRNEEAYEVYKKGAENKVFLSEYQRSLYNIDTLKSHPFWTKAETTYESYLNIIENNWVAIRNEGLKLLTQKGFFTDEAENLKDSGDWKQYELFSRGQKRVKNCEKAPFTCKLVDSFPAARSCKRGQVKFSVMHPGTHVWPHCGPTNCRIRAHIGLQVPQDTFIRVADQTRSWENGKWLIFDDSFEHEVWHNGTETRLVLIVDFWHPDITEAQRRSLLPI